MRYSHGVQIMNTIDKLLEAAVNVCHGHLALLYQGEKITTGAIFLLAGDLINISAALLTLSLP
jgi:hypothetical protein